MGRARDVLRPVALASVMLAALATGCGEHETGPSLSFVVEGETLVPSSTLPDARSLCCCHVQGTVRNTSGIAIHVNLNFDGRASDGRSLGTALDFVPNVPPGGRLPFDAVGIIAPCARVATFTPQHLVTGVWTGP